MDIISIFLISFLIFLALCFLSIMACEKRIPRQPISFEGEAGEMIEIV